MQPKATSMQLGNAGSVPALVKWAKGNPTEFYKLVARLIPLEVTGTDGGPFAQTIKVDVQFVKPNLE